MSCDHPVPLVRPVYRGDLGRCTAGGAKDAGAGGGAEMTITIHHAEAESIPYPDDHFDGLVTDPPYGYGFMGKDWDKAVVGMNTWKEVLRVMKPGAFGFIMSAPRQDVLARMIVNLQDAGFETGFTSIYWAYACVSDDTEVLTKEGWKQWEQLRMSNNYDSILIYDQDKDRYSFESPSAWNAYEVEEDLFRIKSARTDQFVSRNHKVLTSQGIRLAENLGEQAEVVYLPDLPPNFQRVACGDSQEARDSRNVLHSELPAKGGHQKITYEWQAYPSMLRNPETRTSGEDVRREELGLEGRRNLLQDPRKLCWGKICEVPPGVLADGSEGWLCDGTPSHGGPGHREAATQDRGGASRGSHPGQQSFDELSSLCQQSGSQTLRTRPSYRTTLATVSREPYRGIIYCPTVSTGLFVARRNGLIFITGNTGFPKASNISKMVDKRLGVDGHGKTFNVTMPTSPLAKSLDGAYAGFQPKPAVEVILVVMKPLSEKSYLDQAMKDGKGVTWLEAGRIPINGADKKVLEAKNPHTVKALNEVYGDYSMCREPWEVPQGRFPANLLVSDDVLDVGRVTKSVGGDQNKRGKKGIFGNGETKSSVPGGYGDTGTFSRYFSLDAWWEALPESVRKAFPFLICPKPSKAEKNLGCRNIDNETYLDESRHDKEAIGCNNPRNRTGKASKGNIHPTVKPVKLMSYLIAIGSRPGDLIFDPFMGSGTTLVAAKAMGRRAVGLDNDGDYIPVAEARVKAVNQGLF
jgi:hypothetical protein